MVMNQFSHFKAEILSSSLLNVVCGRRLQKHKVQKRRIQVKALSMHDNLTRKAIFLSLFIAENCFKRERTAESRGLSGAILSSTIQGWPGNQSKRIGGVIRSFKIKFIEHSNKLS